MPDGSVIQGGYTSVRTHCRQTFQLVELLAGEAALGPRQAKYGFLEEVNGFPAPHQETAIPQGMAVILLLDAQDGLVKVLPDTEENRAAARKALAAAGKQPGRPASTPQPAATQPPATKQPAASLKPPATKAPSPPPSPAGRGSK